MGAYSFVEKICQSKFNFTIGEEIGYGAQGQVFLIKEDPTKVIKISILYDIDPIVDIDIIFEKIERVYNFIIDFTPSHLVKIYEFGRLDTGSRLVVGGLQDYIVYYSIQEKLVPLTEDEKKVFKTICQSINGELNSNRSVEEITKELANWFHFSIDEVLHFYHSLSKSVVQNNDFHRRNIMKDNNGCYKLIDFDLAELNKG